MDFGKGLFNVASFTIETAVAAGEAVGKGVKDVYSNVIKIGLAFLRLFENRGIKNMHNTSRNEKMAWQTGGTGPPKKNI